MTLALWILIRKNLDYYFHNITISSAKRNNTTKKIDTNTNTNTNTLAVTECFLLPF